MSSWSPCSIWSRQNGSILYAYVAQRIKNELETYHPEVLQYFLVASKDRDYQFWKGNALCANLYSNSIIKERLKDIHRNPVKAEFSTIPEDYRFSSDPFLYGVR